jgi:NADH:ubiquinone oxidoreductase subunit E
MTQRPTPRGICKTCRHAQTCTLRVQSDDPVFHCEEFESCGAEVPPSEAPSSSAGRSLAQPEQAAEPDDIEYGGLCSDCANRLVCMYAGTEGGVWHCEEYDWMPAPELSAVEAASEEHDEPSPETIRKTLEKHAGERGALIAILQDIQDEYGYLPPVALQTVSEGLGCSLVDVYGVATFYRGFSLKPRGKHTISVCAGTACHVRNGPLVVEEFERQLGIQRGGTTADGMFTLETVNCLGACALGPIVKVDEQYFSNVGTAKVRVILRKLQRGLARVERQASAVSEAPGA